MAYIYGLIIVGLFFTVMHFFTELDLKQKMGATVLILLFVMGALYYNALQDEKAEHVRDVMLRFNQGKSLQCDGLEVDKNNFSLSVGTQTFIAREQTPYSGKMVAASECE
jgi:c-di-AMP phosphodiesterase-like protein